MILRKIFKLGLRLRPRWESLQRSPDRLVGFNEPTLLREFKAWGIEEWKGRWKETGGNVSGLKRRRPPSVASHPMSEILKNTRIAELI